MALGGMGFDRLNVEFKDMKAGNMLQRTFAEVLLIHRSNSDSTQTCYILKNDRIFSDADIENFKQGFYQFDKEDFLLVGEVFAINKPQKYVVLKSQHSISYNHLIIATGSKDSMVYEFIAGVNTLVDAIRFRKKIPSSFPEAMKTHSGRKKMKSSKTNHSDLNFPKKIESIKTRRIKKQQDATSGTLNNPHKKLYEVQI